MKFVIMRYDTLRDLERKVVAVLKASSQKEADDAVTELNKRAAERNSPGVTFNAEALRVVCANASTLLIVLDKATYRDDELPVRDVKPVRDVGSVREVKPLREENNAPYTHATHIEVNHSAVKPINRKY